MKGILHASIILTLLLSCGDDKEPAVKSNTADTATAKNYFPVLEYLKSEIRFVDSLPGGIKMITNINGNIDSGYISTEVFDQMASEFIPTHIDSASLVTNYNEETFYDNSINSATFLYSAINNTLPVRNIHVLSRQDAAYDKVTSIYMEKVLGSPDSTITKKMTWVPGKEFSINQEVQIQGKAPDRSITKVTWSSWGEVQ